MAVVSIENNSKDSPFDPLGRDNFGVCLRRAREARGTSLGEVSASTKVPQSTLTVLESGHLEQLPAEVFVRGFIRSYAKTVGLDEARPLQLYERALEARRDAERAHSKTPVIDPILSGPGGGEDEAPKGTMGLAVFVIILLLIATITLSLLLRRPPQSGEGLSQRAVPASSVAPPSAPA